MQNIDQDHKEIIIQAGYQGINSLDFSPDYPDGYTPENISISELDNN